MRYILLFILAISVVSISAADWPQFHGPNRDNKSSDTGLLKAWPEGGPSRIWEAAGIGEGYSTVSIVGNRIYTAGAIDGATGFVDASISARIFRSDVNKLGQYGLVALISIVAVIAYFIIAQIIASLLQ